MGDGGEAAPKKAAVKVDPKIEFLGSFILRSLKIKTDKWQKLLGESESREAMKFFFENQYAESMIFQLSAGQVLLVSHSYPTRSKMKMVFIVRKDTPCSCLTLEDLQENCMIGDLIPGNVLNLSVFMDDVMVPMLQNKLNQIGWTSVMQSDVQLECQQFRNVIAQLKGNMMNRTILPLPICIDEVMEMAEEISQKNLSRITPAIKDSLEGIIIKWCDSVNDLIRIKAETQIYALEEYPKPENLFDFWAARLENLEDLVRQFGTAKIKTVAFVLEKIKSVFVGAFRNMTHDILKALEEARDISMHLQPLKKIVDKIEGIELDENKDKIRPLLLTTGCVWCYSKYFCTTDNMKLLFKFLNNTLIDCSMKTLGTDSIFQGEIDEAFNRSTFILNILDYYRTEYEEIKANLRTKYDLSKNPYAQDWSWQPDTVFNRLELFIKRVKEMREIFALGLEFMKLEKVEIGGYRGRYISMALEKVYEEFNQSYREWANITYNPCDPDPALHEFKRDQRKFHKKMDVLQRKLAYQFERALADSHDIVLTIQLIELGASILHLPLIKKQTYKHVLNTITRFATELDNVKKIFDDYIELHNRVGDENIPVDINFPQLSGIVCFIKKLKLRISEPYEEFPYSEYDEIFECEYGEDVIKRYLELMDIIYDFEYKTIKKWKVQVLLDIDEGLRRNLIHLDDRNYYYVNFTDKMRDAFLDIKNLKNMGYKPKDNLLDFYNRQQEFWTARLKLTRICEWFNEILHTAVSCEYNLIKKDIDIIVGMIKPLRTKQNWNSYDADFVAQTFSKVKNVHKRLMKTKSNVNAIREKIQSWGNIPLYERKNRNPKELIDVVRRNAILKQRKLEILETKVLIHKLLNVNLKLFFELPEIQSWIAAPSTDSQFQQRRVSSLTAEATVILREEEEEEEEDIPIIEPDNAAQADAETEAILKELDEEDVENFEQYKIYLDEIITEEILQALTNGIKYIRDEIENRFENDTPIFVVTMLLVLSQITYDPDLDPNSENSFLVFLEKLFSDIYNQAEMLTKLRPTESEVTYADTIGDCILLIKMKGEILTKVKYTFEVVRTYVAKEFTDKSFIWKTDRDQYLLEIKTYGKVLNEVERTNDAERPKPLKDDFPPLPAYKLQINYFIKLFNDITLEWKNFATFGIWLKLDQKVFKDIVLSEVQAWIDLFKNDLIDKVKSCLQELEDFVNEASDTLKAECEKEDFENLKKVMNVLSRVNEKQAMYDQMFEPLRAIVDLLKTYKYEFDDKVFMQFSELPERWSRVKKQATNAKQAIAPIQAYHMDLVEKRVLLYNIRLINFRQRFLDSPFFKPPPLKDVYHRLDKFQQELKIFEDYVKMLKDSTQLFNLPDPDEAKLIRCRREIRILKMTWDYVVAIDATIDDWKKTPWRRIDTESIDQECKKFGKEIRNVDKEARTWEPYVYGEAVIKNLMTSVRAITELQNPAIKERHWLELMETTHVKFELTSSTTLADLLALNLHHFEDEVKNIVDKSVKEQAMEKVIKDIQVAWATMEFGIEVHERTNLKLLRASEELIETLEDHQSQLQNMLSSKFIGFFFDEVTNWQNKLSNADQVISSWFEVQRKWQYLESIFIGSDDIRNQLPEDSKRFDNIDREFKGLLSGMDKNVVRATNKAGLYDKLDLLNRQLVLCEKALNDYLETKRLAYPRFYFVSSADLLDILSNGNKPLMVCRHLTKLYDSLGKLTFIPNSTNAKAMIAKELEEYIPFLKPCDCSGKVEVWLNRVTDKMRETLRDHFRKSIIAYEDKPRHVWILDWPAQPTLVATQIWWTAEVNDSFSKLELGYENAMKDFNRKQINQLNNLIILLLGDLTGAERQKIMTVCTIDVHSRDVVGKIILQRVETGFAFQWQSQLRHRWDQKIDDCFANICDAEFLYDYEFLGNTPRLVITPLTDRCYITLTQSLHLVMGGAPAGPAGTGKTETTKDLGRALGIMVYVFNCSEQMDYKSVGDIHKGLAQSGSWGCFDEFNRISVEVLSVIAVQVKCIQDAIKGKKQIFNFLGEIIALRPTVGMFITMNPGYAGRAELPENLKALYRPCAMVVPDFALISEIMLVAEGFQEARLLARKFITLYTLCKELLSKQDHYDWGLRAIKSVLVVAGSLRRGDRFRPEDQVLMRALRDFNIPKIVTDDVPVFMGLIGDLFPAMDIPRKRNLDFEKTIKKSAQDLSLQPEDGFILKVVQLEELFAVRHSVFVIGFAGTGKSEVWKTLNKTYANQKRKPWFNDLNPKAVTNDELFGIVNPATREWKDGLFSIIMRDQANMGGTGPKWIVLDGDIDPMWIESLNTLMDDNKVLTLASNERIALSKEMRLLFEISNLRTATPATVSRAGILYINPQDLGWNPFVTSWISQRSNKSEHATLMVLFEKYVPPMLDAFKGKLKKITPISEIAMIQMTCFLLEAFLTPQNVPTDCPKDWYEIYFAFAILWGFGSTLFQDQIVDWRVEFHKWWMNEFKAVKFPATGTIFSYYVDQDTKKFLPWTNLVPNFELDPDIPLQSNLVNTAESTRLRYFLDLLIEANHPIMLIGPPGSGKTMLMNAKLASLPEKYAIQNVPFNFYTTSEMLQRVLEKPLEKKAGRNFGPPGNKRMIYFVDDMNMPEVDKYGTVQPHTLIRQFQDYNHWYDRIRMSLKDIHNCQFVSCMNPFAGSFTIDPRLQRHFCSFAVNVPGGDALFHILHSILSQHLAFPQHKFDQSVIDICKPLIYTAISLHQKVVSSFLPTAIKFHYNFNLRDIANIFTGVLYANNETAPNFNMLLRLWAHESTRVYGDKLVDLEDLKTFKKLIMDQTRKGIENFNEDIVFQQPLIYCHFAKGLGDIKYMPIHSWEHLNRLLIEAQEGFNELVGAMSLVLFEDAMAHICRISRILESSRGYALLIGVGGSGKQSLTALACFISSLDVFQIQLTKDYTVLDLKANIASLYMKAGVKSTPNCFLMTDSEVAKENFLVVINDLLASGEIHELFADDEIENIIGAIRNEVKQMQIPDTRENCWKYYIDKVRALLKVVLCFSPVGATLRVRARKFPALVNCTTVDWFHEWPTDALESVSLRFVGELEALPYELARSVSKFMAFVHGTVNSISVTYLQNDKRYNYTTPKSFLELISLYSKLLNDKYRAIKERIYRLENGLVKLASCTEEVDSLQDVLKEQEVILVVKNEAADKLILKVSSENEKVSKERAFAAEEERKVRIVEEEVTAVVAVVEEDFRKAQPALLAAQEALSTLNKNNLTELKSFGSPPDAVVNVCAAVLVLFSQKGKIPKDRSWKNCRTVMGNVDQFLNNLINYDKEHIHPDIIKALQVYLQDPDFNPEKIQSKSLAAAGLAAWVINIYRFYEVFLTVEPKIRALNQAQNQLKAARDKLQALNDQLNALEEKLNLIQAEFDAAMAEKKACQDLADKTAFTIDIAHRLINGLSTEKVRWIESVKNLKENLITLPGDVLLVSCFISYVGCFTRPYRVELKKLWIPAFKTTEPPIPTSQDSDPFEMICDDAQIAEWNNQGLPSDRMSAENAAILVWSDRYPLIIDPQLQGIKWVKQKYAKEILIARLSQPTYLDSVERAVKSGNVLLLENIGENVDPVLNPLLGRQLIKKGTCLKLGDREIDFNPKFRLILHTKLANPHYKPEMQAQTTLINFTVTRDGLEDQLLAEVVKAERPDLEQLRIKLTQQQNTFKITLKFLEEDLLRRLASAGDNVLEDVTLVMNLEKTKKTAEEIEVKVAEAKITAVQIDSARELYRPAATRASIIYFILNDMFKINPIYQFSLKAFNVVFANAMARAEPSETVKGRVVNLVDSITFLSFLYTSRGLFERDKLIFLSQLAIQILLNLGEIDPVELDFLLRFPYNPNVYSPVPFLTHQLWGGIKSLVGLDSFKGLDKDIEISPKRWKKYCEAECPEKERLPGEWKGKSAFQRLCVMRCLRPDRMTYAIVKFIEEKLEPKYVETRGVPFAKTFEESSPETHIFFILSPGVDPLKDVERLGKVLGFSSDRENLHNVSLGQGQEIIAENAINIACKQGHWVILQNIHLVAKWLSRLEKTMEGTYGNADPNYRLYLSAEAASDPAGHILPQGILESAVKITNEPPTGMLANIHKALDNFNQETLEMCSKETEFKAILFSLCYFHAVMAERRKFGPQGWNRVYPFNVGDLTISVYVLYNYLEANSRVPWEDLRYLFGEIMYGGHITDDWDRRLCRTYLEEYMQPELIDGELYYSQGFLAPGNFDYKGYHKYIDDYLPPESPQLYGLHLNAEIGFLTALAERLFKVVFELQPRSAGGAGGGEATQDEVVRGIVEDVLEKVPTPFSIVELMGRTEDRSPYVIVAFQEAERMNGLMREIFRSLKECELGLKGELTISPIMESLMATLFMDGVPESWAKLAYPSLLGLQSWFADLLLRLRALEDWVSDFKFPTTVWLGGFFNPQSFLTAIMQQTARKNEWPLDRMCLNCDVTKKMKEDITAPPREGAFISGLFMEGARWDTKIGSIADSYMQELFPTLPVIYIKAITQDKQDTKNIYECPVYKIRMRGPTYVWTFNLKTKEKASKWVLAGVGILLQI